ncbi:MAG: hypothetical protein RLY43_2041 [Bacteroidota bacterium]|jgi:hypothetical protein
MLEFLSNILVGFIGLFVVSCIAIFIADKRGSRPLDFALIEMVLSAMMILVFLYTIGAAIVKVFK